jgi:hypothetical protein
MMVRPYEGAILIAHALVGVVALWQMFRRSLAGLLLGATYYAAQVVYAEIEGVLYGIKMNPSFSFYIRLGSDARLCLNLFASALLVAFFIAYAKRPLDNRVPTAPNT